MNRLMQGESLPIFGDGEQRRAFTYIKDITPAIARSPLEPAARNQIFNVGSDQHYSVNELALEVIAAMDMPGRLEHRDARNEVKLAFSDHSKFHAAFPDGRSTPLSEGIRRMALWAKASGIRQSREFDGIRSGSDQHYSVNELALEVIAAMDMPGRLEHRDARNEVKLAFSDHSKFHAAFPDGRSTPLSEGIRRMALWAKASGIRQSREFDGI